MDEELEVPAMGIAPTLNKDSQKCLAELRRKARLYDAIVKYPFSLNKHLPNSRTYWLSTKDFGQCHETRKSAIDAFLEWAAEQEQER